MKIKLYRLTMVILCVAGIFFTGSRAAGAEGLVVVVAAESVVDGPTFTLGDIASISGDDDGRIAGLKELRLGYSPQPGQSLVLTGQLLGTRLRAAHTDFSGITWQVPPQFRITASAQLVGRDRLVSQAEYYLKQQFAGADAVITPIDLPQDVFVPAGSLKFTIDLPYGIKYNTPTNVHIGIVVAGQLYTTAKMKFDIRKYQQVVVASRMMTAGDTVAAESVSLERRDIGRISPGYFTQLNKVLGLVVKRQLSPGTAITDSMLEKPMLIKRGQTVRIVAEFGGIEVSAPGIALQNGSQGQQIRVQNVNSKKIITGRIVDETTVRI